MSKGVLLSQPKDKSLEAFKAWLTEMFTHITGKTGDDGSVTEQEWIDDWKTFWSEHE